MELAADTCAARLVELDDCVDALVQLLVRDLAIDMVVPHDLRRVGSETSQDGRDCLNLVLFEPSDGRQALAVVVDGASDAAGVAPSRAGREVVAQGERRNGHAGLPNGDVAS